MLKCMLIDDEPLAVQLLADYIEKTDSVELAQSFTDPIQALHFVQENPVDLIFLDVQMPELTGIQLMKILKQRYPVILTTAYEQYALDGFEHNVVDYLLKPISYDRFFRAVQKVAQNRPAGPEAIEDAPRDFIFVKSEYRVVKIDLKDIFFLEGLSDYVAIHLADRKILTLENMKHFEQILPADQFIRVHKSYLIAFSKIDFIERNRVVIGKKWIPVSDTYKKAFWERIKKS
jgi:two-component system LytT family response regulator